MAVVYACNVMEVCMLEEWPAVAVWSLEMCW